MPITRPIDTLVLGGGMAGTFAALAAKTPDTTVAIVEPANVLGGQGTAGGVAGFCGDSQRVNAPFARLVETLAQHDLIAEYDPLADRRAYDLELCAFFLQEMVAAAGVEILFHARALTVHNATVGTSPQSRLPVPLTASSSSPAWSSMPLATAP